MRSKRFRPQVVYLHSDVPRIENRLEHLISLGFQKGLKLAVDRAELVCIEGCKIIVDSDEPKCYERLSQK